ncbi:MAG TPA: hypothetical protein VFY95_03720, partial [Sphingomicrobium sp.]
MQAAANRAPAPGGERRADNPIVKPHLVTADDTGLLGALPIAAAIIQGGPDGSLTVTAHNSRFSQMVRTSTCTASDWNEADCLKSGPIAEVLRNYFAGTDDNGELDFRDGE